MHNLLIHTFVTVSKQAQTSFLNNQFQFHLEYSSLKFMNDISYMLIQLSLLRNTGYSYVQLTYLS